MKRKLKGSHCLWYALAGLAVFLFAAYQFRLFTANSAVRACEILSDALIMPGILLSGVAALSWTGSLGTYDMLGYGIKCLFFFLPQKDAERHKTFYDYRRAKEEKGRKWFPEMLIVGLGYVLLSIAALVVSMIL